eukprot:50364-Ditylum_brightwellii.AAC.1
MSLKHQHWRQNIPPKIFTKRERKCSQLTTATGKKPFTNPMNRPTTTIMTQLSTPKWRRRTPQQILPQ